jgi:hypothetical protein
MREIDLLEHGLALSQAVRAEEKNKDAKPSET